jgi:hypothetical protein
LRHGIAEDADRRVGTSMNDSLEVESSVQRDDGRTNEQAIAKSTVTGW